MLSVLAVWPARPSVETHPVAEVRAGREDRGHAHVDQKGLPVSQRLVLLLRRWRRLPLGRTCPGGPPSHFSVLTRAEEWEGQRWVTRSEDNNGKDAVTRALPGRSEPHVSSLVMLTLVRCPLVTTSPRGPGGPHGQGRGLRRTAATAVTTGAHFAPAPVVRCSHQIRKGNGGAHLLPHSPRAPRQMLTHRARVTADTKTPHVPTHPAPPDSQHCCNPAWRTFPRHPGCSWWAAFLVVSRSGPGSAGTMRSVHAPGLSQERPAEACGPICRQHRHSHPRQHLPRR